MGRSNGSTNKKRRREQVSKRTRFLGDRLDLDLLVRYAAQHDREQVWR